MPQQLKVAIVLLIMAGCAVGVAVLSSGSTPDPPPDADEPLAYQPRIKLDPSGQAIVVAEMELWKDPTSLEDIRQAFQGVGPRLIERFGPPVESAQDEAMRLFKIAHLHLYDAEAKRAYEVLHKARVLVEANPNLAERTLYSIIFMQAIAALRRGEDENCVECRGEGSCIFPLLPTAIHAQPTGSRLAIKHCTEYLDQFPDDVGVRWLLNLAHMTLGEHPHKVAARFRLDFSNFGREADIGRFRDIAHLLDLNRLNQAGGAIMDDFDNDGLLDIVVTTWDPTQAMAFYKNMADGTFVDRTEAAGLTKQYGGLYTVQADYNNDGFLDIFTPRGAWYKHPMRPSLLRNNGNGTFTDVTREAGLIEPLNSITAAWADYDNDGWLDLYVASDNSHNRLYRNKGNGTFEEVAERAGVLGTDKTCKGIAWLDFDNDGWSDLFLNYFMGKAQLFRNNGNGTFTEVTEQMGITGPEVGFSCWAFDYDNDGWLDIFATCYQRSLDDVIRSMQGMPLRPGMDVTRLFRNAQGKRFEDVSAAMGVNKVFATMGSNFADFDNDGFLDFYLATGEPSLATLVPNRMFKNMAGKRFAEITATAGTGNLQKGHAVACGDWDRDGNIDMFAQTGGATPGDRFRNALYQNPGGHGHAWLTVKLIGKKTNRAALGARIKIVTKGAEPMTVCRHVTSGSSFGANALQQTIGLGKAASIARLEIRWPTSGATQVFNDVPVNQAIELTEFATEFRKLDWKPLPAPK